VKLNSKTNVTTTTTSSINKDTQTTTTKSSDTKNGVQENDVRYYFMDESISRILDFSTDDDIHDDEGRRPKQIINADTLELKWDELYRYISSSPDTKQTSETAANDSAKQAMPKLILSSQDLAWIATECEYVLFKFATSTILPKPIQALMQMSLKDDENANVVIATLLSLNVLESSIRSITNHATGKAPLLKNMIESILHSRNKIKDDNDESNKYHLLAAILRTLLLPTKKDGLNLRNLVWHGFTSYLPPKWLALCIVLTLNIDTLAITAAAAAGSNSEKQQLKTSIFESTTSSPINPKEETNDASYNVIKSIKSLQQDETMMKLIQHGKCILDNPSFLSQLHQLACCCCSSSKNKTTTNNNGKNVPFLPPTHEHILQTSLQTLSKHYPVCFTAVMSTLLEHALRVWWCDANDLVQHKKARPDYYYVTLDGHGQRDKHDVVIMPYISSDSSFSSTTTTTSSSSSSSNNTKKKRMTRQEQKEYDTSFIKPNKLMYQMDTSGYGGGGALVSLLADLFASPCGGPNIRASISHGLLDAFMYRELEDMLNKEDASFGFVNNVEVEQKEQVMDNVSSSSSSSSSLVSLSYIMVATLHLLSFAKKEHHNDIIITTTTTSTSNHDKNSNNDSNLPSPINLLETYQPLFSYTASMKSNINDVLHQLKQLSAFITNHETLIQSSLYTMNAEQQRMILNVKETLDFGCSFDFLDKMTHNILNVSNEEKSDGGSDDDDYYYSSTAATRRHHCWTTKDVFQEHSFNVKLMECGAARILLFDISEAVKTYLDSMEGILADFERDDDDDDDDNNNSSTSSNRKRKRLMRLCAVSCMCLKFYSFAAYVALCFIDRRTTATALDNADDSAATVENGCIPKKNYSPPSSLLSDAMLLKGVERSRMCVSTVSTFTATNVDRVFKSVNEYMAGKSVKAILSFQEEILL